MPRARRVVAALTILALGAPLTFCAAGPPSPPQPPVAQVSPPPSNHDAEAVTEVVADAGPADPFDAPIADSPRFASIPALVDAALADHKLPGCVVVIGRRDEILYKRAFGKRQVDPPVEAPMQIDTVFDLASLTKPIATAASVMALVDRGDVALDEPVARYLPDFGRAGKGSITVRQLLLHTGGLAADNPMSDFEHGPAAAMERIFDAPPRHAAGERFVYSDVGYIVLAELVRRVSGKGFEVFAREAIFEPLGMKETAFLPDAKLRERAAPTEVRNDAGMMVGEVHDPRAFALGGVAGHAGLFSTARDLSRFARAWLGRGTLDGARVVAPATLGEFTASHDVPGAIRALGWDVASAYSKHRGEGMSRRAIGHGGYTGTALWIDPAADLFVLFLSNRVHPNGKGSVHDLTAKIASVASASVGSVKPPSPCEGNPAAVLTGIDVLRAEGFASLKGKRVGLLTNASGRAKDGLRTVDLLREAEGVELVRLFAPEHGLGADREGLLADGHDSATGLPVVSLYGTTLAPPKESLSGLDALVFDVQDVGVRFYTYPSTLRRAMRAAADAGIELVVLDRPNPIDGVDVAGPLADDGSRSFVHHGPLPVRHGMTIGELALLFDAEEHMGLDLRVVPMRGWRRASYHDTTGLSWVNPSPNLRNVTETVLYPAVGIVEGTNISVGRGTDMPFEVVGAPFVDGPALAAALSRRGLAGVSFTATTFTPKASPYKGEACHGVRLKITDRAKFEPVRVGVAIALELKTLHAPKWHFDDVLRLLANRSALDAMAQGRPIAEIEATWEKDLLAFRKRREKYLLYPESCSK